jgi:translocation and assembly module TamA
MRIATWILAIVAGITPFATQLALATVTYSGLPDALEKNARALMPLASAPCNSASFRIERLFRDSDAKLREALEALGYYRYEMQKSLDLEDSKCWTATFDVVLGEPVRLRQVSVVLQGEAEDDEWFRQEKRSQWPASGDVLDHGAYERFKKQLLANVQGRGYFEAEWVRNEVVVNESMTSADMLLEIDSGPRYHFGDTSYSEDVLRPALLANYAEFQPGDPYSAEAISDLHESLSGSGYFGTVSIRAEPLEDGSNIVPVYVTLSPGMRQVYTTGLGYATDIGVQGRLGYTNRRLNDLGHQFDSQLYASSVDSQVSGTYRWPRGNPEAEWVDIFGGYQHKRTDTSETDKVTFGIRVSRNRTPLWLETPYINFTGEDFRVGDQVDKSRLLIPGISWESTIGREISRIRSGHRISLDVRGSLDEIGSDTSFLQLTGATKWAFPLGKSNRGRQILEVFLECEAKVCTREQAD